MIMYKFKAYVLKRNPKKKDLDWKKSAKNLIDISIGWISIHTASLMYYLVLTGCLCFIFC
ncbi:hypothetical protein SAMN05421692_1419 [Chryseobacterium indologenes]|nr:hypothetical protein SAMN05421692_1419 [Chryseobacterium indologenes]SUX53430.1 Uncharacterised protein [Chryseobacterium indologenes]